MGILVTDRLARIGRVADGCRRLLPGRVAPIAVLLAATLAALPASAIAQTDVIVNNPATDTNDDHTSQFETTMAVRGNTVCAGYNDSGPGAFSSGLSRSTNSGTSWTDRGSIGQEPAENGDPSIAVHRASGTFYYAEIATIAPNPSGNLNAIGVARSTDNCANFGDPVNASPASSGMANNVLSDKPWIAVDNTGGARDGDIYVCWTRVFDLATPTGNVRSFELRFSRSIDGGATYQNEQVLMPAGTRPFGCSVGVGPNGEVNVAWADRQAPNGVFFRRSTDGGVNFTPAATVSAANRTPGSDRIVACPQPADPTRTDFTLNADIRQLHQAWMAVDATGGQFNGNIYVVWASDPVGTPDNSDVFFSRSTNGGVIWSPAVQIGTGGGATDQFEPMISVGGNGAVSIAWFDRRNDQANNRLIDVYKTFSQTGGAAFNAVTRVTDQSFDVPRLNPNFDTLVANCGHGEYMSVAGDASNFYYLWTDDRNRIVNPPLWPAPGRPDPDVFFERELAPSASGAPATLTLAPKTATNPVDTQHCVTATVRDSGGNPVLNVTVRFSVSGSVNTSGARTTNTGGQATFCYQGPALPGSDVINAFADSNNNGAQDLGEPSDTATKTWVLPSGTALCVVKITNGGWIIANNGDRGSFGGNAKESSDLVASGNEEYQDHGPAQPLNVHSISVQALTCANNRTRGTVFGQATIDGSGVHNFRIDVQDLGEPGKGKDTYRIRLDTGYDSGEHVLRGGNVQIH
jgi:hypothetical protein